MNLAEIILFISSISSKKDFYLDKISELDDIRYVNTYFSHIEKYILLDNKIDETFQSNMDRSYMMNNQFVKLREEFERERETLIKTIKENEKIINKLNSKNENLERLNLEIGIKLKDKQKELEFFKLNQNQNIRAQEEMFKDNLINSELIIKLNEKEIELNDVKRENEVAVKRLNDDLIRYKEKIEAYDDKLQEYKSFKVQNDKLNLKIKELNIVKERNKDYEDIKNNLDHKNKQIENLLKEKQILVNEIEKLRKEILNEKEKFRQADFDKKKMECDYNEVRKEFSRLESKNRFNNFYDLKRMPSNINNNSEILAEDMKLIDLGGDSMIFDDLKDYKIKNTVNEKEYLEVKNEKNELYKLYKAQIDEIHKLIDEKDRLLNTIDNYKLETEKYNSDKERLGIEKEKLEIIIQKSDLDCQKLKIHIERYENEKKRMEEENKELNEKMEILTNDRNLKIKEIEQLKNSANFNKNLADKALSEKQSVVNECHNLQLENEKLKFNWSDPNNNLLQPTINKNKSKVKFIRKNNLDFTKEFSKFI
jgi:chromosome segregation ATPase